MPDQAQCHRATPAVQWTVTAVLAVSVFAPRAQAQPAKAATPVSISGVYNGTYAGEQGPIKFKLSLTQQDTEKVNGTFALYLPDGPGTKTYTCDVTGFLQANGTFALGRRPWVNPPPASVVWVGIDGKFDPAGGKGAGQISGKMRSRPAPEFQATRDPDESAKLAPAFAAKNAAAAGAALAAINGVYTGEFQRSDGNSKLKFSIRSKDDGSLTALFTFGPPADQEGPSITYKLTGRYDAGAHDKWGNRLDPFQFTTIEPIGSGAKEALDASKARALRLGINSPGSIAGSLTGFDPKIGEFTCGRITATRDGAASADLDKAMLAQASAATAHAAPAAPAAAIVRHPFEGVYNGTYVDQKAATNKVKLRLWLQQENRAVNAKLVNTAIAGLLTVFATDAAGTMPYTTEVHGFYINGNVQLTGGSWDPPPSGVFLLAGLEGKFDPGSGGNAAPQISGGSKFKVIRDAAESAKMDVERLRKHVHPGIVGVFNGTYTRQNEPPTKFKLSITHNGDGPQGLAGMATIYLPVDSGTRAYTYALTGIQTYHGEFQLQVNDWVTPPPKDFKNFRAMGFTGKVVLNDALTTAQMSSIRPPPSSTPEFLPKFEATYDAAESADINGVIAAQKAVGDADLAAALKARNQTIKNAPPKELASKDLVRKSRKYWDGFRTDMIREVFDGGFGAAVDENGQFQALFCSYVETFSAKCPDCLPANRQTVLVTQSNNRKFDANGNLINQDVRTFSIQMDPRFVEKYQQFSKSMSMQGAGIRGVLAAQQSGGIQRVLGDMLAVATDMQKFFADHGGKSAATRQMNENFLRAINGQPSLQQAGGKIEGAEAESDKDLPPGRYARFVDAANSYFRERAARSPAKFGNSSSHDTAFCQRLAELCKSHMSREEDYYYANDFEGRFGPIMGPRQNCPDPAWPQLHPDVEKAIEEVK